MKTAGGQFAGFTSLSFISGINEKWSEEAMRLHKTMFVVMNALLILSLCDTISSQDKASKVTQNPNYRVLGMADRQQAALGKRMKSAGKEKTTYDGQLFDKNGKAASVRVVHDVSGLVRLEGFREKDENLFFDGKKAKSSADGKKIKDDAAQKADEDLLEVFVMDTVEGMFESMGEGAAVRLLGSGFRPDPRTYPDYQGPRYDVYEVTTAVRCREDRLVRAKLYYFDSDTGLLLSTRYYDRSVSPAVQIETRYSVWGEIDGSKYPARIEHYVGGNLQFDFIANSISGEASLGKSQY
jgi:hypothetical protein